jgi:hypothetical protein
LPVTGCCPLPLPVDVQAELFPEVQHSRTERRKLRSSLAFTRKMRREERALAHHWRLRQNLLGQAVTELNFQSPETVSSWYRRWSNEFDARELALPSGTGDRDMPRWPLWTGCGMPGSRCVVSSMKSASL